ncbi:MAG: hypothetical protein ACYC2H_01400 [Thermoplasmatota archaeon]
MDERIDRQILASLAQRSGAQAADDDRHTLVPGWLPFDATPNPYGDPILRAAWARGYADGE